jgi:hypothetical protein
MAVMTIMTRTTTMSWTIRKPTAIRPWSSSISRLSDRSLTMMIVEENVSATAMYSAGTVAYPSARAIKNPATDVKRIWPSPVASATGPVAVQLCLHHIVEVGGIEPPSRETSAPASPSAANSELSDTRTLSASTLMTYPGLA